MVNIIIFGAGIAGLTAAHELLDRGYNVTLYEKLDEIGGFARSSKDVDNMPTEHSWRGYAPFYDNFFDIAKRIPLATSGKTVYDNLSSPITFLLPHDSLTTRGMYFKAGVYDYAILLYYIIKCATSDKRREIFSQKSYKDTVINSLSQAGKDKFIESVGPGLGLDQNVASITHITKFSEMDVTASHTHDENSNKKYKHTSGWHVMKRPTTEAWFNPWIIYLKNKGLILYLNSELKTIELSHNKVMRCQVNDDYIGQTNDIFIFCINPFEFKTVLYNSGILNEAYPELYKFKYLVENESHSQPSFSLLFNKKINLPQQNLCFIFPDSEFNITLYPQDNFFEAIDLPTNTSLWSGTVCEANRSGKLYNKSAIELTIAQLKNEIIHQIMRSAELNQLIEEYNSYKFEDLHIVKSEIWYEWHYGDSNKLVTTNPKWVNTLKTYKFRPNYKTNILNLYLGGAHCNTSTDIWSMEGAVESGKSITKKIINSNNTENSMVQYHNSPSYMIPFQLLDNILYTLRLPQLIDCIIAIIIIMLIIVTIYIYKKYKKSNK